MGDEWTGKEMSGRFLWMEFNRARAAEYLTMMSVCALISPLNRYRYIPRSPYYA